MKFNKKIKKREEKVAIHQISIGKHAGEAPGQRKMFQIEEGNPAMIKEENVQA